MSDLLGVVKNSICPEGVPVETLRGKTVLAAVSGGVDSMVMLDVLRKLSFEVGFSLRVITVNHNIRPDAETSGDAEHVVKVCAALGIPCSLQVLRRGLVEEISAARGKGTEEAARFLRYEAFEEEARNTGADVVCIAHNRNDRLETILQRFLQGAGVLSSFGMKKHRGIYSRPLFDVSRREIEEYAEQNGISFRTDLSNADNAYFRNRIRNSLIPFLNDIEPGWDSAVIHGAEKNMVAADDINAAKKNAAWTFDCGASGETASKLSDVKPSGKTKGGATSGATLCKGKLSGGEFSCKKSGCATLWMNAAVFDTCPFTARIALLYDGLTLLKCPKRIPYSMLASFSGGAGKVSGAGIKLERKSKRVFLSVVDDCSGENEESGFYVFVTHPGRYIIGNVDVTIRAAAENAGNLSFNLIPGKNPSAENRSVYVAETDEGCVSGVFKLPCVIRSGSSADAFRTPVGERKLLSKIFSDWHVPAEIRWKIPVFEDSENRGVWGSLYGYEDWFVKPEA